jgi:hypothetical protein
MNEYHTCQNHHTRQKHALVHLVEYWGLQWVHVQALGQELSYRGHQLVCVQSLIIKFCLSVNLSNIFVLSESLIPVITCAHTRQSCDTNARFPSVFFQNEDLNVFPNMSQPGFHLGHGCTDNPKR